MGTSLAAPTPAQPPRFTLHDALVYARAHQPSLRAAQERVRVAQEQAQVPRAGWLPRAGGTAQILGGTANNSSASYFSVSSVDIPRVGGTAGNLPDPAWNPSASTFAGVGLRQEIFDFGRLTAQAAALDLLAKAADERATLARFDLDLAVEQAYFAVQASKGVLRAADAALVRAQAHRDLAGAGVHAGLRSPIELTRAEADLARFQVGRLRAAGSLATAQTLLAATIGSPDAMVDASDEEIPVGAAPSLEQVLASLDASDPAIREGHRLLEAQRENTRAVQNRLLPDLSLAAGINTRGGGTPTSNGVVLPGNGLIPSVPNWDVGLVLSWSFLDPQLSRQVSVSRRQEQVRQAELESIAQVDRALVQRRYVEFQVAQEELPALTRALEAAQANHAQAEARFKAGLGTSVELADAEALLTDAEIQLALGRFEQSRARALLGRAISEAIP